MSFLDNFRGKTFKAELDQAIKERDELKSQLAALTTENAVLQTKLSEVGTLQYFELKDRLMLMADRERTLQLNIDGLQAKYTQEALAAEAVLAAKKQAMQEKADAEEANLQARIANLRAELASFDQRIEERREQIVVLDEEILLQSFGVYQPKYDFANSSVYQDRLDTVRSKQKQMIKEGKATDAPTTWTVNNSRQEGERMIKDNIKLIVRSFNNECDASIISTKFNNVESIEKRILKAFDVLNDLGRRLGISITDEYLKLKLQELYLYHEYQLKKQKEKEEQKREREELREAAKVARELEEMRAKIGKEEKHFARALDNINTQLEAAPDESARLLLEREKAKIEERLVEIEHNKQDLINREQNTRAGYVYVISNIGAFGENVYKIGVTRRLEPQERIDELGDASVPFDFDIHALVFSDDAPALENALHKAFEDRRLNMINRRREFFHVTIQEIEEVIKRHFKKPVEIAELPEAQEYRQSLMLKQSDSSGAPHAN